MQAAKKQAGGTLLATFRKVKESRWTMRLAPVAILVALMVLFAVWTGGRFVTAVNVKIILDQALIIATVATGAAFIFATGNVNIAMGACTALTATITAKAYLSTNSLPVMILVAVVFGALLLLLCAFLSTIFKVRVMFVTIVMMVLLENIKSEILDGETLSLPFEMTSWLQDAGFSYIIFVLFFLFCAVIFHFTSVGRAIRFTGSNMICGEQTGIFRNKYLVIAFVIAGVGVGLGSLLTIARSGSITASTASSMNMDCMLAIVLGGMPVFGGSKSRAYAAVVGALTVTVLNNGLLMVGVSSTILQGVRGVLFLLLVLMSNGRPDVLPARD